MGLSRKVCLKFGNSRGSFEAQAGDRGEGVSGWLRVEQKQPPETTGPTPTPAHTWTPILHRGMSRPVLLKVEPGLDPRAPVRPPVVLLLEEGVLTDWQGAARMFITTLVSCLSGGTGARKRGHPVS